MKKRPLRIVFDFVLGIAGLYGFAWLAINYLGLGYAQEYDGVKDLWLKLAGLFTLLFILWHIYLWLSSKKKKPES
ncbi:hypothetical protein [Corynebacterium pseudopelargi]|uniref:DUF4405 domain-containing protein n=1 Tax=Corynebacterium pseudopelargi TaxID=2080757 RepID=A0A3G6IW84_9CORY|nr:hypothetical protein [Corynebacterium pseudopelargi]AZA08224.1 hypothetical protein CPPEL_00365 [Corynebacterium pseudopelargi]